MDELKNNLQAISIKVNDLLTRYIAIHDKIFKFSFRKIIRLPLIFRRVDFQSHHREAESILAQLNDCKVIIDKMTPESRSGKKEYLEVLSRYAIALIETVNLLKIVLGELYEKSQNSKQYNYEQYKKDLAFYEDAVKKYVNLGQKLNVFYQNVLHQKVQ